MTIGVFLVNCGFIVLDNRCFRTRLFFVKLDNRCFLAK